MNQYNNFDYGAYSAYVLHPLKTLQKYNRYINNFRTAMLCIDKEECLLSNDEEGYYWGLRCNFETSWFSERVFDLLFQTRKREINQINIEKLHKRLLIFDKMAKRNSSFYDIERWNETHKKQHPMTEDKVNFSRHDEYYYVNNWKNNIAREQKQLKKLFSVQNVVICGGFYCMN